MGEPYRRLRTFYQDISSNRRILSTDTGVINLVAAPGNANDSYFIQKIHVEVTTLNAGGELWTFQDGAGTPLPVVPSISTAAIAHFDFDFGPAGAQLTAGKSFDINITVTTGAVGWITWEGYKQRTVVAVP